MKINNTLKYNPLSNTSPTFPCFQGIPIIFENLKRVENILYFSKLPWTNPVVIVIPRLSPSGLQVAPKGELK